DSRVAAAGSGDGKATAACSRGFGTCHPTAGPPPLRGPCPGVPADRGRVSLHRAVQGLLVVRCRSFVAYPSPQREQGAPSGAAGSQHYSCNGPLGATRANSFAARLNSSGKPVAAHVKERPRPYPHFLYLVKAIEVLVHTWYSPYPAERALLTTGLHDAL